MSYQPLVAVKQLANIIRSFAQSDPRVGSFRIGDILGVDTVVEEDHPLIIYELVRCKMIGSRHGQRNNEYTVRLYCFDQRLLDNSNLEDAFSDCQNILTDLIIRMQDDEELESKGMYFPENRPADFDYVIKTGVDSLIGVTMDFTINTPIVLCAAQIPTE